MAIKKLENSSSFDSGMLAEFNSACLAEDEGSSPNHRDHDRHEVPERQPLPHYSTRALNRLAPKRRGN